MRILHLYRPRLPSFRAQAIQVLHSCHALARRGHEVTLLADRGDAPPDAAMALGMMGLPPVEGLELQISPKRQNTLAGLWFRRQIAQWWAGPPGLIIARDKQRLAQALGSHGKRHQILLETHELDSMIARDNDSPTAAPLATLEADLLGQIDVLIANCGGTLAAWEAHHALPPDLGRSVIHNATRASHRRDPVESFSCVARCVGSLAPYKGIDTLMAAAPHMDIPLELVGGTAEDHRQLGPIPDNLFFQPAIHPAAVPDLLAHSEVLVLSLADNRFGRELTSPLKLFDYLATSVPIVAPDLPTVREIQEMAGTEFLLHAPGDPASLAAHVNAAREAPLRTPWVRTWDDRAAELEACFP
jgi:glycosyltransferase involved in cell wall biosynthesis